MHKNFFFLISWPNNLLSCPKWQPEEEEELLETTKQKDDDANNLINESHDADKWMRWPQVKG